MDLGHFKEAAIWKTVGGIWIVGSSRVSARCSSRNTYTVAPNFRIRTAIGAVTAKVVACHCAARPEIGEPRHLHGHSIV
jgi:hypothetical protein